MQKPRWSIFTHISFILILTFGCAKEDHWEYLLEGNDLSTFSKLNGEAEYYLEDGVLTGVSKTNTPNTFLSNNVVYDDFILEFEVKIDTLLNSGVQFRSISDPAIMEGRVHGYQVEIETSPRKWAGGIYDEARRGWLYSLEENPTGQEAFKYGEWNKYRVEAIGSEIRTWVNTIQCANLQDSLSKEGIIAFQVHAISDETLANKKVRWRNIRVQKQNLKESRWVVNEKIKLINNPGL